MFRCANSDPAYMMDPITYECEECRECCWGNTGMACKFVSYLTPTLVTLSKAIITLTTIASVGSTISAGAISTLASAVGASGPCFVLSAVQFFPLIAMMDAEMHSLYRGFLAYFAVFNGQFNPPAFLLLDENCPTGEKVHLTGVDAFLESRKISADNLLLGNLFWVGMGSALCAGAIVVIVILANVYLEKSKHLTASRFLSKFFVSVWYSSFSGLCVSSFIVISKSTRFSFVILAYVVLTLQILVVFGFLWFLTYSLQLSPQHGECRHVPTTV